MKAIPLRSRILLGAAAIVLLMALFPPWKSRIPQRPVSMGYSFFLVQPRAKSIPAEYAGVDTGLLLTQIVVVAAIAGFSVAAIPRSRQD
jgi:hypothetical protein